MQIHFVDQHDSFGLQGIVEMRVGLRHAPGYIGRQRQDDAITAAELAKLELLRFSSLRFYGHDEADRAIYDMRVRYAGHQRGDCSPNSVQLLDPEIEIPPIPLSSQFLILHRVEPFEELPEVRPGGERTLQRRAPREFPLEFFRRLRNADDSPIGVVKTLQSARGAQHRRIRRRELSRPVLSADRISQIGDSCRPSCVPIRFRPLPPVSRATAPFRDGRWEENSRP